MLNVTFEQAMGLLENVKITDNGYKAVFEFVIQPKHKETTTQLLQHWENSNDKEAQLLLKRLYLEKAYCS